jgi:prophage regulatory protein
MTTITALPSTGFIRLPQVLSLIPVSRTAWYQGIKEGRFPAPVKLSERTAAWRISDIRALLASYGEAANDGED